MIPVQSMKVPVGRLRSRFTYPRTMTHDGTQKPAEGAPPQERPFAPLRLFDTLQTLGMSDETTGLNRKDKALRNLGCPFLIGREFGEMIKGIIDLGGGEPVRIKFKESSAGEILWIKGAFPTWGCPA